MDTGKLLMGVKLYLFFHSCTYDEYVNLHLLLIIHLTMMKSEGVNLIIGVNIGNF
jgi:hypothetical protein